MKPPKSFKEFLEMRIQHNKNSCRCKFLTKEQRDKSVICVDCFALKELQIVLDNYIKQEVVLSNSIVPPSNSPSASAKAENIICVKEENQK